MVAGRLAHSQTSPMPSPSVSSWSGFAIVGQLSAASSPVEAFHKDLQPALHKLHKALLAKAQEFDAIVKIGRTHLMDATPIRLGQVFSGYASQVAHADRRIQQKVVILRELPIGGDEKPGF